MGKLLIFTRELKEIKMEDPKDKATYVDYLLLATIVIMFTFSVLFLTWRLV